VSIYRQRLYDVSLLMPNLNEYIAREANEEDNCSGRFYLPPYLALALWPAEAVQILSYNLWEGRFKSQALLDVNAVLGCMAFVDINPIRVKMNTMPETSKHTSIKQRIHCLIKGEQPRKLMRFVRNHRQNMHKRIAYSLIDYCELVDCTGRYLRIQ
jgi:hypothetical protein